MILGLGSDLTDIGRIERGIQRYGERFVARFFTEAEQSRAQGHSRPAQVYAKRFAAKEACAKALGTGIGEHAAWREIAVVNRPGGQPALELSGAAARRLADLTPAGMTARIDLSITDEPPLAHAIVIISAVPEASVREP